MIACNAISYHHRQEILLAPSTFPLLNPVPPVPNRARIAATPLNEAARQQDTPASAARRQRTSNHCRNRANGSNILVNTQREDFANRHIAPIVIHKDPSGSMSSQNRRRCKNLRLAARGQTAANYASNTIPPSLPFCSNMPLKAKWS